MRIPVLRGLIERRILVNFRVQPEVLVRILPPPFRSQLVAGWGMAGICLIRLRAIRPRGFPARLGLASENAAHRIAVEWETGGRLRAGVFIPRRDTSSWLNAAVGGRVFPGVHHQARFDVCEEGGRFQIAMASRDGSARVSLDAQAASALPSDSVFASLDEASRFFEAGAVGYSPAAGNGHFDGLELRSGRWQVEPLAVRRVESSFFADEATFPAGSVEFDHALLMRDIDHEWHSRESICRAVGG